MCNRSGVEMTRVGRITAVDRVNLLIESPRDLHLEPVPAGSLGVAMQAAKGLTRVAQPRERTSALPFSFERGFWCAC